MRYLVLIMFTIGFLSISCKTKKTVTATPTKKAEIKKEESSPKPETGDKVFFHVVMRTADSTLFDSHKRKVQDIVLRDVKPNSKEAILTDGLKSMNIGERKTIFYKLDSIDRRRQGFENIDTIFYDLELVDIKTKSDADVEKLKLQKQEKTIADKVTKTAAAYKAGTLKNIQTTDSGLKYVIHKKGKGGKPNTGDEVYVHYFGALTDGTPFDNSFKRGHPFTFNIGKGRVIKGWDEGIALLSPGAKATFFIPSDLAYGERGAGKVIPPNSELIFYVELLEIKGN